MAVFVNRAPGNVAYKFAASGVMYLKHLVDEKNTKEWALDIQRRIDRGEEPSVLKMRQEKLLPNLIDLHPHEIHQIGRPARRPKASVIEFVKTKTGGNSVPARLQRIWHQEPAVS